MRYEVSRILLAFSAPVAVAAVFPYAALGFSARDPGHPKRPCVAFVKLDDAAYEAALRTAKSAWQMETGAARESRTLLSLGELPEEVSGPILTRLPSRPVEADLTPVDYMPSAWKPSVAAPPATRIAVCPEKVPLPFSREELLALP